MWIEEQEQEEEEEEKNIYKKYIICICMIYNVGF
jgi:hypothetical protein